MSKDFQLNFTSLEINSYKKFNNIVLVGMGGSILGAKAIYGFLKNKIKKNFFFLENLDNRLIKKLYDKNLKNSLYLIISKSGNTLETLEKLKFLIQKKINKKNIIIIYEKNKNILFKFSKKNKIKHVVHKKYIGGRYSVFRRLVCCQQSLWA